jgi:hypothetical protein
MGQTWPLINGRLRPLLLVVGVFQERHPPLGIIAPSPTRRELGLDGEGGRAITREQARISASTPHAATNHTSLQQLQDIQAEERPPCRQLPDGLSAALPCPALLSGRNGGIPRPNLNLNSVILPARSFPQHLHSPLHRRVALPLDLDPGTSSQQPAPPLTASFRHSPLLCSALLGFRATSCDDHGRQTPGPWRLHTTHLHSSRLHDLVA